VHVLTQVYLKLSRHWPVVQETLSLTAVREAMAALAAAFAQDELATQAFALYDCFRPKIDPGQRGWDRTGRWLLNVSGNSLEIADSSRSLRSSNCTEHTSHQSGIESHSGSDS